MVHYFPMRLDHVSYVASHDQISDVVQRIGAQLGTAFVDGGIHPRFGTRNFTASLLNGQYVEVVCPLDHPAAEATAWGKAVTKKANEGGGWLTWVFATKDIAPIEAKFGRPAIEGHRKRPDGTELTWKQLGVTEIADQPELPFFIQWLSSDHPSVDGKAHAEITKIEIAAKGELDDSWFKDDIHAALRDLEIQWVDPSTAEGESGIVSIAFSNGAVIS